MALELELEAKIEETRRMEQSLRAGFAAFVDKVNERSMLLTMKQEMIAKEAPREKFVQDFMVFMEAIENGHLQILKNFDEKDMLNTVSTMIKTDAGEHGREQTQTVLGKDPDTPVDVVAAAMETAASGVMMG
ncbi:hypothetical protein V6N13_064101 [Hibiscus sabdariffa]|uniref:Uncharacterized protein n=2 Tax=Hibiscus sabdariffa TaxID=183260 RepID=A0ABR2R245_9ROSI